LEAIEKISKIIILDYRRDMYLLKAAKKEEKLVTKMENCKGISEE
jgi:hypothetical protein